MGLPSSSLNAPLFQPSPTQGAAFEFGNPRPRQGTPSPIPMPILGQINPQDLPPFTGNEAQALQRYLMGQGHGVSGQFPFQRMF